MFDIRAACFLAIRQSREADLLVLLGHASASRLRAADFLTLAITAFCTAAAEDRIRGVHARMAQHVVDRFIGPDRVLVLGQQDDEFWEAALSFSKTNSRNGVRKLLKSRARSGIPCWSTDGDVISDVAALPQCPLCRAFDWVYERRHCAPSGFVASWLASSVGICDVCGRDLKERAAS